MSQNADKNIPHAFFSWIKSSSYALHFSMYVFDIVLYKSPMMQREQMWIMWTQAQLVCIREKPSSPINNR